MCNPAWYRNKSMNYITLVVKVFYSTHRDTPENEPNLEIVVSIFLLFF